MGFCEDRGMACCGLACVLCSYEGHEDCPGCVADIQDREDDCFIRQCAAKKEIDGCYACLEYPCGKDWFMLHDKRNIAFIRYAREFGKQALIDRLRHNDENGITYHKPGTQPHQYTGDYDMETEEEIYQLLRYGRRTPY